jgi:L-iditol 2-dehydrogenase
MIDVDCLISEVKPLADGAEWFARLHKGEEGLTKVILTP